MRGLRMEAGQRGAARYGLPGAAVDAPPGRSDCVAAGALHAAQPAGAARAARSRADRYNATTPLDGRLSQLGRLDFQQVRRSGDEPLFPSLTAQPPYLGSEPR